MDPDLVYEHLENLAEQLGISIVYDDLGDSEVGAASGLCKVKGRNLLIMDRSTDLTERIKVLSGCLGRMELDRVYVMPAIRKLLKE